MESFLHTAEFTDDHSLRDDIHKAREEKSPTMWTLAFRDEKFEADYVRLAQTEQKRYVPLFLVFNIVWRFCVVHLDSLVTHGFCVSTLSRMHLDAYLALTVATLCGWTLCTLTGRKNEAVLLLRLHVVLAPLATVYTYLEEFYLCGGFLKRFAPQRTRLDPPLLVPLRCEGMNRNLLPPYAHVASTHAMLDAWVFGVVWKYAIPTRLILLLVNALVIESFAEITLTGLTVGITLALFSQLYSNERMERESYLDQALIRDLVNVRTKTIMMQHRDAVERTERAIQLHRSRIRNSMRLSFPDYEIVSLNTLAVLNRTFGGLMIGEKELAAVLQESTATFSPQSAAIDALCGSPCFGSACVSAAQASSQFYLRRLEVEGETSKLKLAASKLLDGAQDFSSDVREMLRRQGTAIPARGADGGHHVHNALPLDVFEGEYEGKHVVLNVLKDLSELPEPSIVALVHRFRDVALASSSQPDGIVQLCAIAFQPNVTVAFRRYDGISLHETVKASIRVSHQDVGDEDDEGELMLRGGLDLYTFYKLASQLAETVKGLHALGIVHGAISLQTISLVRKHKPYVTADEDDGGDDDELFDPKVRRAVLGPPSLYQIFKQPSQFWNAHVSTKAGKEDSVANVARCIPPELRQSLDEFEPENDIWSLGRVFWEMLTARTYQDDFTAKDARLPAETPRDLARLIHRCLSVGFHNRPSAATLHEVLKKYSDHVPDLLASPDIVSTTDDDSESAKGSTL